MKTIIRGWLRTVPPFVIIVLVACGGSDSTTPTYQVGGTVKGLSGQGLVLALNSGSSLAVSGNGPFQFAAGLTTGTSYSVTVQSQPTELPTLLCNVSNSSGHIGSADVTNVAVSCESPALALLAGRLGGRGNLDGQSDLARFGNPGSVAVDTDGTVYVADGPFGVTTIRKITPDGLVSTIAGQWGVAGFADGTGSAALFGIVAGLAANGADGVYVADSGNQVIRKVSSSGVVTTIAGQPGVAGSLNGVGSGAQFQDPVGVVADAAANLYVGDSGNDTIRKITPDGSVTTFAGQPGNPGGTNGNVSVATFYRPGPLAIDSSGSLYVADVGYGVVRKITGTTVTTVATPPGQPPGFVNCGTFCLGGIAVDSAGIYVSDSARNMVYLLTPGGALQTVAGSYAEPLGLAVDSHATLYIADSGNDVIREVSASGAFSTLAGAPPSFGSTDGPAPQAEFYFPAGIVRDSQGNLFITDANNNTIREITSSGVVSTFAGQATGSGVYRDGTGSAARSNGPEGIAIDAADNLYVTDSGNGVIRKVTPGAVVTTIAGNNPNTGVGTNCSSGDGTGKAAGFCLPDGIVIDGTGNLYVADTNNDTIRKITPGGVVTTFAGSTGMAGSADGIGAAARFNSPGGLAIDGAGNLYLADSANDTIRKITPGAVVTTLAGTPGVAGSHDGTGSAATFSYPLGVALDPAGNLYVTAGGTIRVISPGGLVTTIAGTPGSVGIRIGSLPGSLNISRGILVDAASGLHLIVTDDSENVVLWITPP